MPPALIQTFAQRAGRSAKAVEKLWDKAKELAAEAGREEDYAVKNIASLAASSAVTACCHGSSGHGLQAGTKLPLGQEPSTTFEWIGLGERDYAYVVGILKRMLKIESGEGGPSPDFSFLSEALGEGAARRMLHEKMPSSVKAAVAMRWLEIEKQLRNAEHGAVSWPTLARSLRMAVYTLLNWATSDKADESRFRRFVGII